MIKHEREEIHMSNIVQSVDRTLEILELLSNHVEGLSIKDISERLGFHKSTVHRLLGTLIYKGYVEQDPVTNHYLVTLKLFQLGSRKVENTDVIKVSKPFLNKLAQLSGEVVHLVLRDGVDIIYVDKVEGNHIIRMHSRIGHRSPMYCTAVGKAIMATLDEEKNRLIFDQSPVEQLTEKTITTYDDFVSSRQDIYNKGYAIDDEENEPGVTCVAVAIKDFSGESHAAISISGPTERMNKESIDKYSVALKEYCHLISQQLGYQ